MLLKFSCGKNLTLNELSEGHPWDFVPDPTTLQQLRTVPKLQRRKILLMSSTQWSVYSPVVGVNPSLRITGDGKGNPPRSLRGIVVDYDAEMDFKDVEKFVNQMPEEFQPNFYEVSLGMKARLVWVFQKEVLTIDNAHCARLIAEFVDAMKLRTLLPGFDDASLKPTEVWTSGSPYYTLKEQPLAESIVSGIAVSAARKTDIGSTQSISLVKINEEIQRRYPNRWIGPFEENAVGVRFWDEKADAVAGAQVKKDGMVCFTGPVPFMSWSDIFGHDWVKKEQVLHLGQGAENLYFDGRGYWELGMGNRWVSLQRADIDLVLATRGLSAKIPKHETVSEADKVLRYIQTANRVEGAAPLINYAPGIVDVNGKRVLNITTVKALQPAEVITGDPALDFPFIWRFLNGFFARPENRPLAHFLGWLHRFYNAILNHRCDMGQAVFLCGPPNNGKTLMVFRIIAPLVGNRWANPMSYMVGDTTFNDNLVEAPLLTVNDEESPTDRQRSRFEAKTKSLVANPITEYHPKFCPKVTATWVGRFVATLNDDPSSVGMLPPIHESTADKMSFYASQPFSGVWPDGPVLEATIAAELPKFAKWLLDDFLLPEDLRSGDRCGVKSYFDPQILNLSSTQLHAYNLKELLNTWSSMDQQMCEKGEWTGTPTDLFAQMASCDALTQLMRDWNVTKIAKSLTGLAKSRTAGVEFVDGDRVFKILKTK